MVNKKLKVPFFCGCKTAGCSHAWFSPKCSWLQYIKTHKFHRNTALNYNYFKTLPYTVLPKSKLPVASPFSRNLILQESLAWKFWNILWQTKTCTSWNKLLLNNFLSPIQFVCSEYWNCFVLIARTHTLR